MGRLKPFSSGNGSALILCVFFLNNRYEAEGSWPPSPGRLFQALLAGATCGSLLERRFECALAQIEALDPPSIAAPFARRGATRTAYVPDNNMDSVLCDLSRVAEIRTSKKYTSEKILATDEPLMYVWNLPNEWEKNVEADAICAMADKLYQLGRGTDMAWAHARTCNRSEAERLLSEFQGIVYRPTDSKDRSITLAVPTSGSLASLRDRFEAGGALFERIQLQKSSMVVKKSLPRAKFGEQAYNGESNLLLLELRSTERAEFAPWPLSRAAQLVEAIRNAAAARMKRTVPQNAALIERYLIGRSSTDPATRLRIVPIPSVGMRYTDASIRRVLIIRPPNCPLVKGDVLWVFTGLDLNLDYETGEVLGSVLPHLLEAEGDAMLRSYHAPKGFGFKRWQTITPAALPEKVARRRISPGRIADEAEWKSAKERLDEEERAAKCVLAALRHAEVSTSVVELRLQREPFSERGERAEAFAKGTRFEARRLWHVSIEFAEPVAGPLAIGDGRFLGLGVMLAVDDPTKLETFDVAPRADESRAAEAETDDEGGSGVDGGEGDDAEE